MSLSIIESSSGDFKPTVKFNCKHGKWSFRHDGNDIDIDPPTALFDFANVQTGWLLFEAGQKPQRTMDPDLTTRALRVNPDQKRGLVMHLYSTKFPAPGVAEFSSNAITLNNAINALHDDYVEGLANNPGKLPVVKAGGVQQVGKHQNFAPTLEIIDWVDRPADFADELPLPDEIGQAEGVLTNGAAHVPPPAAAAAGAEF